MELTLGQQLNQELVPIYQINLNGLYFSTLLA